MKQMKFSNEIYCCFVRGKNGSEAYLISFKNEPLIFNFFKLNGQMSLKNLKPYCNARTS